MADTGLKIVLDADLNKGIKAVETFVSAIEKAEGPVFDLDKAVKEATARINANIDRMAANAVTGNDKLEKSIGPVVSAFSKLKAAQGSIGVFKDISVAGFAKITPAATKAAASLDKLGKSGSGASTTLINAGRILSDSPYGFIGIANNIEPLLESFRRLQTETGSTKNAFKSLLSGLAGGGGIGLAFSAALAAVQFLSLGFDRWTGSTKAAGKATKETAEDVKFFSESVASDIVKVNILSAVIGDSTRSLNDRKDALTELRKLYPEYLKGLSNEEALTKGVQGAVDLLTKSLIRRGIIAAYQTKINKTIADSLEDARKEQQQFVTSNDELDQSLKGVTSTQTKLLTKQEQNDAAYRSYIDFAKANANPSQFIFEKIQDQIKPLIDEMLKLGGSTDEILNKFDKQVKKKAIEPLEEVKDKIRNLIQEGLNETSGNLANNRLIIDAAVKFRQEQVQQEIKNIQEFVKTVNTPATAPTVILKMDADISALLAKLKAAEDAVKAAADKFDQDVNAALQSTLVNAATGIADAIASAIEGNGNIFGSLLTVVASAMKDFGKALIAIGTGVLVAKKTLATNPAAAIAAGFVLTIAGAALQAAIPKFAEGGIVTGPTIGMIGEAGPEVVFPLSDLQKFVGERQGGQVVVLQTAVRGSDLLLIQQRAGSSFKRTNG